MPVCHADTFSPSGCHRRLVADNRPALAYDGGDVATWQSALRPELQRLLGAWPARRPPLDVRRLWSLDHPLGLLKKIAFTTEPGSTATAYIGVPRDRPGPHRWIICLQGHSTGMHNSLAIDREDETSPILVQGDRDFALQCLRQGYACLCLEQRSLGDRRESSLPVSPDRGMCQQAAMHSLLLGRTLVGERVYDVDRALDYLITRADVRPDQIGIMGHSGGGTVAIYSAALLPRISFAMPSCAFCPFADSLLAVPHCECNYIPGLLLKAEMSDLLGLFAPKPVVIVAGVEDDIFPIDATRRAYSELRAIYERAGHLERCVLVEGSGGHRFYADPAWPALHSVLSAA